MSRRQGGGGSVFKQPGCNTFTIQCYDHGKRIREYTGLTDYKAAQQHLRQTLERIGKGTYVTPSRVKPKLVRDLFSGLERDYIIMGRKTLKTARARWRRHVEPHFGDIIAQNVSDKDVESYVDRRLEQSAKNGSINNELALLRRMLVLGKIKERPEFKKLKENNVRVNFVEDKDYSALTSRASELWLRCFLELAFAYGWRSGELKGLRVRNIDLQVRTITLDVGRTKSGEGRVVTMTGAVYLLLKEAVAGKAANDYVFTRENGKRVRDFRRTWWNLCLQAGLGEMLCPNCGKAVGQQPCDCGSKKEPRYRGLNPHDFRRSAARAYRRAGVSEGVIMKVCGWETRTVFERYNIKDTNDVAEAVTAREKVRAENDSRDFSRDLTSDTPTGVLDGIAKAN